MNGVSRFQLDLNADEMSAIERWSGLAGFRTKKEFLLNAFTLFKWAASQVLLGRTICAVNETNGEIRHLEMPALSSIAEGGIAPPLSDEEMHRRLAEPGPRLAPSQILAQFKVKGDRDGDPASELEPSRAT